MGTEYRAFHREAETDGSEEFTFIFDPLFRAPYEVEAEIFHLPPNVSVIKTPVEPSYTVFERFDLSPLGVVANSVWTYIRTADRVNEVRVVGPDNTVISSMSDEAFENCAEENLPVKRFELITGDEVVNYSLPNGFSFASENDSENLDEIRSFFDTVTTYRA